MKTLGEGVWAYKFQHGNETVLAIWSLEGARTVSVSVRSSQAEVVDMMGRSKPVLVKQGYHSADHRRGAGLRGIKITAGWKRPCILPVIPPASGNNPG